MRGVEVVLDESVDIGRWCCGLGCCGGDDDDMAGLEACPELDSQTQPVCSTRQMDSMGKSYSLLWREG